jgi:hypothetical protein
MRSPVLWESCAHIMPDTAERAKLEETSRLKAERVAENSERLPTFFRTS